MIQLAQETDETRLRRLGIRPTAQRLAVYRLLRDRADSHVTPQEAFDLVRAQGLRLTLGTIYNVLNEFARAGVVSRIDMGERTCFCSNRAPHHHFLDEGSKRLFDITGEQPVVNRLPAIPEGMELTGVEVIVRIRPRRAP
ncbi:hypothetical protein A6A04_14645 [Paramagnetospirillum marisnigri]|uniref:Ferric uptake regulation protein n=1 Tax=Paramagnetospirillum marisnigri TaxID=1285242 RepID=A0A178MTT7_9PROT|nr:transcriptional repressor [Paramagnetospirillum marisnigri]OAN53188.1 hypothetical protein A6A04_14645 [Paramagnetospirillum marisnigri]